MSDLYLKNVSLSFGEKKILKGLSFNVKKQSKLALFGLNGAGKTSLIHAILGLLNYKGEILVQGEKAGTKKARQAIFYLPERFRPHACFKGRDYLRIFLGQYKLERARHLPYLNQQIRHYSKGMAQQLGMELVKDCNSPLLILDEPTSGLDFLRQKELKCLLQAIDTTLIITGHDPHFLQSIADHLLIMHQGRNLFSGPFPQLKGEKLEKWISEMISKQYEVYP